jgi:hypothetical protein
MEQEFKMISCRYVGSTSVVGERTYDEVGQRASFSEQQFRDVLLGGAAFILEEDFKKVGFGDDELSMFGPSGSRVDPTPEFNRKLAAARSMCHELRKNLNATTSIRNFGAYADVGA